jgi:hypothetical protein
MGMYPCFSRYFNKVEPWAPPRWYLLTVQSLQTFANFLRLFVSIRVYTCHWILSIILVSYPLYTVSLLFCIPSFPFHIRYVFPVITISVLTNTVVGDGLKLELIGTCIGFKARLEWNSDKQ